MSPKLLEGTLQNVARPSRFQIDDVLAAALDLLVEGGAEAVTMTAVAERLSAPSGSVYYRVGGRPELLARLWLRAAEAFRAATATSWDGSDALAAALGGARAIVAFAVAEPRQAYAVGCVRRADLHEVQWSPELRDAAGKLVSEDLAALTDLAGRLGASLERTTFAVRDVPWAAVRPALQQGRAPDPDLAPLVSEAVIALLARSASRF